MVAHTALELRQGHSLVMTQQLLQSIHFLQLSTQELHEIIHQEIEKNPLLVRPDDMVDDSYQATPLNSHEKALKELDMDHQAMWGDESSFSGDGKSSTDVIEQRESDSETLHSMLLSQVRLLTANDAEQSMAYWMVDQVDANGYLPPDLEKHIANDERRAVFDKVLCYLQQCDPAGVGARNLQECLTLQLIDKGIYDKDVKRLLEHLDALASGDIRRVCRLCNMTPDQVRDKLALIRQCNPKPGSQYQPHVTRTLIADIQVTQQDGKWDVELNPDTLPTALVNTDYLAYLKQAIRDKDELKMLSEHTHNASWLQRSLHQRNVTLLKVAQAIIEQQQDFFEFGVDYLKPMTLKDISLIADCHESTVSRISTSKYLSSLRGTYELKYFFTSSLHNMNGGENYSNRSVMHRIKEMIDTESPTRILSDETIARALKAQGIDVARRTVVKYRKQLNLGSSVERRRIKTMSFM